MEGVPCYKSLASLQYLRRLQSNAPTEFLNAEMQIEQIIKSLKSGDLEKQDSAFKEMNLLVANFADEAVDALREASSPIVVAEDIFLVADKIRTAVQRLYSSTASQELKSISACLLVQMGSRIGVEHLLHVIRTGSDYDTVAATSLANAGLREALPALITRLASFEPTFYLKRENAPVVHTFLVALDKLGGKLPAHLRAKFSAPDVPPDLSSFV
jgi:hypothetical protein